MITDGPKHDAWLDQVQEDIVDPDREIVDPHHHLWRYPQFVPYVLEDFWGDTGSGHNVTKTVFIECGTDYRREGEPSLQPVGETEFVAEIAAESAKGGPGRATIAGIVSSTRR